MPGRNRHQDKDIERLLQEAESRGWRVESPPARYFRLRCPCADKHMKWVHLTPSGANYGKNLAAWLKRCHCWERHDPS